MSDPNAPAPHERGRKVCIVGFAKTSRDLALYDDPSWEIWGVNDAWSFAHRADRWFEVHSTWIYEWELRRAKGHVDWLRSFGEAGGIVYLLDERPDMPRAVRYPFEFVVNDLWPNPSGEPRHRTSRPYLTSSISYMQALAIAEGFEEIAIVGVDMAADSEYEIQRPGCEYLIGLARGRGIKVWLPESCGLLEGPLYGRGDMNPQGERLSPEQLQARLKRLESHEAKVVVGCDQALGLCQQIKGAIVNAREMIGEFPQNARAIKARIDNLEGQLVQAQQQWGRHMEALNQVRGALVEVRYWIGLTPHGGEARLVPPILLPPQPIVAQSGWTEIAAPPEMHVCGDGCEAPGEHALNGKADETAVPLTSAALKAAYPDAYIRAGAAPGELVVPNGVGHEAMAVTGVSS